MPTTAKRRAIKARIGEAEQRLNRFKSALAQGADPGVVSAWTNEAQADLAKARTDLALLNNEFPAELSRSDPTAPGVTRGGPEPKRSEGAPGEPGRPGGDLPAVPMCELARLDRVARWVVPPQRLPRTSAR